MRDILAAIGAIFLILAIWFMADFNSFDRAVQSVHRTVFARQLNNEVQLVSSSSPTPSQYQLTESPTPNPLLRSR